MADQLELLNRCLTLRSNLCLQRDKCERLLEDEPGAWEVEQLREFRLVRDGVSDQIEQIDRHLATLQQPETLLEPRGRKPRLPWFLLFAVTFLLIVIAL